MKKAFFLILMMLLLFSAAVSGQGVADLKNLILPR